MSDEPHSMRMHKKTRSASICATTGSIESAIRNMPLTSTGGTTSGTATPDSARRRRPATRSQSARISAKQANFATRRRQQTQQQLQYNLQEAKSYCTSEPRLSETETPPQKRKLSQRRPQSQAHRKSNAFLDVPTANMHNLRVSDNDEDLDRLRTFSASKGGIINRGDSFRRRRSRSNSLAPVSPIHPRAGVSAGPAGANRAVENAGHANPHQQIEVFNVEMLGSQGVGKQALVSQFRTSDCINAYDGPECDEAEPNISIILNGVESELKFSAGKSDDKEVLEKADAFLVVYSCIDKESFTRAKQILTRLHDMDLLRLRPIVLVANKIDLARSRSVSAQDGKCLACTFGAKFIEVSVGINHNCDELLAGTLAQIRLKKNQNLLQPNFIKSKEKNKHKEKVLEQDKDRIIKDKNYEHLGHREGNSPAHWYKSRSVVLASMKARQMLTWVLGKEDSKFKNCENLQML